MAETELDIVISELSEYALFMTEEEVCKATGLSPYTVQQKISRADLKNRCRRYKKTDVIQYIMDVKSWAHSTPTKERTRPKTASLRNRRFTPRKSGSDEKALSFSEALEKQTSARPTS